MGCGDHIRAATEPEIETSKRPMKRYKPIVALCPVALNKLYSKRVLNFSQARETTAPL